MSYMSVFSGLAFPVGRGMRTTDNNAMLTSANTDDYEHTFFKSDLCKSFHPINKSMRNVSSF